MKQFILTLLAAHGICWATSVAEDLTCSNENERSVFELNAEREAELAIQRRTLWDTTPREEMAKRVRETLGVRPPEKLVPPTWDDVGRVHREGYHIDKLILRTDSGVPLPALTFHPEEPQDDAYLYLHDEGKLGDSEPGDAIEKLVEEGYAVVAVDLRGQGETASGKPDALLTDWKTFYLAYLLGNSLTGMRVEDAWAAGHFVAYYKRKQENPRRIHLVGVGQAGIVALHTAALHPDLFTSVTLHDTPRDWASVVRHAVPGGRLAATVHGALEVYDLPDLVRLVGEDKVRHRE